MARLDSLAGRTRRSRRNLSLRPEATRTDAFARSIRRLAGSFRRNSLSLYTRPVVLDRPEGDRAHHHRHLFAGPQPDLYFWNDFHRRGDPDSKTPGTAGHSAGAHSGTNRSCPPRSRRPRSAIRRRLSGLPQANLVLIANESASRVIFSGAARSAVTWLILPGAFSR